VANNVYPRETVEFVAVLITIDGVTVTSPTGVELAVVLDGSRPTAWTAAIALSGKIGIIISGLAAGQYRVWARVTSSPETPVIECGYITVT
jgi:hypothetical protein